MWEKKPVFNIAANFVLIPIYGRTGAAWSTLLSTLIITVYLFPAAQRVYFIPYRIVKGLTALTATLILLQVGTLFGEIDLRSVLIKTGLTVSFLLLLFFLRQSSGRGKSLLR